MSKRRQFLALTAGITLIASGVASAQTFPERPIRIIVGFPPGGPTDVYARLVALKLSDRLGQQVIVENKPGAGATIAATYVARSKPDGYTLLMGATNELAAYPAIRGGKLGYRSPDDFTFIGLTFLAPIAILVSTTSGINSFSDFAAAAKSRDVRLAFSGKGGAGQFFMELVRARAGISIIDVPYAGSTAALPDILSGRIDGYAGNFSTLLPHVESKKMKIIAMASAVRETTFPDVKTLKEQGVDVVQAGFWGIVGPSGIPNDIAKKLSDSLSAVLRNAEVVSRVTSVGDSVKDVPQEKFRAYTQQQVRWYTDSLNSVPGLEKRMEE